MSNYFPNLKSTLIHKLLLLSFFLFGIYPLIPEKQESIIVIVLTITSVFFFLKNFKTIKILKMNFLITISLYCGFFLSMFFSEDFEAALIKNTTMLSLFIFPLIFYVLLGSTKMQYNRYKLLFFKTFFFSNVVFSIISIYCFLNYVNPRYPTKDANFFRNAVEDIPLIGDHPIYISIFLSISILIGATLYKYKRANIKENILVAFGHIILIGIIIILMSKGVIIALILSLFVLMLTKFKLKKIFFLIFIIGGILIMFIPSSNNRFHQLFDIDTYISNDVDLDNSTSIRLNILKCTIENIIEKPFFGYGVGDVQNELNKCYSHKKLGFIDKKPNSHNQYAFVWLSSGVFAVILFLFYLGYYFKLAIHNRDYLLLSIITLYSIVFLFENVLSRQSGVILFSFLINFMAIENLKKRNKL